MSLAVQHDDAVAERRRENALSLVLFFGLAIAILLRFVISSQILNMVMPYSSEGGSFPQKLHVGTYAIFGMLVAVLMTRRVLLRDEEVSLFKALLGYSSFIILLLPYLFVAGRAGSAGFIIDSYLVACAAGMALLCVGEAMRRALGHVVLGTIILSAMIGTFEAFTHQRILPYPLLELNFRPTGLNGHPLALGAICGTAIAFVSLTRWRMWVRIVAIFVLFIGVAVSGARAALLLSAAQIFILLLFVRWPGLSRRHEREAKFFVTVLMLVLGSLLIAGLFTGGLLNRFSDTLFDDNFDARVKIYDVFNYVSWNEILFGMKPKDLLDIVNDKLGLPYIESAPVAIALLFGVPIAVIFATAFFWFISRLLRHAPMAAWIGAATFLLTALSNNALSSKAPDITILVVLLMAFRNPVISRSGQDLRATPRPTAYPALSTTSMSPTRLSV